MPAVSSFPALVFSDLDDGKSLPELQFYVWASHKCWGTSTGECSCLLSSNKTILGELLFTFQEALVMWRLSCLKGWPLEQKWPLGWTCSPSLSHSPIPPTPAPNKTTCAQILVHRLLQRKPKKSRVLSVVLDLMAVKWHFVVAQNFTFLIVSEGDHLFLCVLSMLVSAVVNCLFNTQHIHLLGFVWFR